LPAYLQQLVLESNGKSVARDGSALDGSAAAALWGGTGSDGNERHTGHGQGRRRLGRRAHRSCVEQQARDLVRARSQQTACT
jgi:hypothetical protein